MASSDKITTFSTAGQRGDPMQDRNDGRPRHSMR